MRTSLRKSPLASSARQRPELVRDAATSARLATVRQHGTAAELLVRAALRKLGHHYRVGNRDLPGSPDVANRSRRWAIFVHGCFWHRHHRCRRATTPGRNRDFWLAKFEANVARDTRVTGALRDRGYRVLTVWECEVEDDAWLTRRLRWFLG